MGEHKFREKLPQEEQLKRRTAFDAHQAQSARLRSVSWPSVDDNGELALNKIDYVHGTVVSNRAERRAAQLEARRYGCALHEKTTKNAEGKEVLQPLRHGLRCPKYSPPAQSRTLEVRAAREQVAAAAEKVETPAQEATDGV